MGNQNCTENCSGFNENQKTLNHIAFQLDKNKQEEEPEVFSKVKSSKPGNWEKQGI